jgi:Ca-activated chloride channel homolog
MNAIRFQSVAMLHWLWLVPVLVGLLIFAARRRQVALQAFIDAGLLDRIRISVSPARRRVKAGLAIGGLIFLAFGLARPGWNPKPETIQRRGRDVVFLLDVSKSMLAEDLAPNRMERAKLAVQDAVDRLEGDRVGLVVFAGSSVVKCPLTLDYGFFRMMLEDVSTDSISRGGTLIGDAIRKVLDDVFDDEEKQYKDIVLITDGEDHDSFPVEAAETAGKRGARLIAIGLGDENEGRRIPITDTQGRKTFLMHDGQEVWSKLDAHTLRKMVNATPGGKYLNVSTGTIDLGQVYLELIASAEKKDLESATIKRYEEKFQIFLLFALALLGIDAGLSERKRAPSAAAPKSAASLVVVLLLVGLLTPRPSHAVSVEKLIRQGNEAVAKGDLKTARTRYEEASVAEPESAWIAFNQGVVSYRENDFTKALDRFQDAAVRAKDPAFAARAQYNMGNCSFRQAQRQKDSDLQKAIEECRASVTHYQEALRLDPNQKTASENIEVVRLYLKNLLDEQQRRKEAQQQEDEITKTLKELIERQQTSLNNGGQLESTRGPAADPPPADWEAGIAKLTQEQESLQTDSAGLLTKMQERQQQMAQAAQAPAQPQNQGQSQAPTPDPAAIAKAAEKLGASAGHVGAAVNDQGAALTSLRTQSLPEARPHQAKSLEELVLALQELSDPQQQQDQQNKDQDQKQDQGDQKDQPKDEGKQDQEKQEGDSQKKSEKEQEQAQDGEKKPEPGNPEEKEAKESSTPPEGAESKEATAVEAAHDILDEEKENQRRRTPATLRGGRAVDKDW